MLVSVCLYACECVYMYTPMSLCMSVHMCISVNCDCEFVNICVLVCVLLFCISMCESVCLWRPAEGARSFGA